MNWTPDVQNIRRNATEDFSISLLSDFSNFKRIKRTLGLCYSQLFQIEGKKILKMPESDQRKMKIRAAILGMKRQLAHLQNQKTTDTSSTLLE